jgi:predicted AlkP superfamily pyrophosphatase or phosphodiesterase
MKKIVFLLAVMLLAVSGSAQPRRLPYVILVSFDGFRTDYAERFNLPNFKAFIRDGASSEGLIPSFPSKTFPNHYTIVTGLYPGNHGLVDNHFFDPEKKKPYSMRNRDAVTDSAYYGGTPLWRLARQQGVRSASYFWVGSELKEEGLHPDYYYDYNQAVPFGDRVDQVIRWLKLPEKERPHIITLYFSSPDTESHKYGPLAEETKQKVMAMDSLLGNLMQRVDSTKLPVNVILVSDHGMSELTEQPETYIFLDELVTTREGTVIVSNGGTQAHLYTTSETKSDSLYTCLKSKEKDFTVVRRKDFPVQWHYDHQRAGDLLIVASPGKYIVTGDPVKLKQQMNTGAKFGVHGYDPDQVPDMYGIFYAKGPNIKPGSRLKAFRNIHVYPLIAEILQLRIPKIDGQLRELQAIYRK